MISPSAESFLVRFATLLSVLQQLHGCQLYPIFNTMMKGEHVLARPPVGPPEASPSDLSSLSCQCCGLCSQRSDCHSFSVHAQNGECVLFDSVASFDTLDPAVSGHRTDQQIIEHFEGSLLRRAVDFSSWEYFFLPARSRSGQFCATTEDCVEDGDICSGMICTTNTTVTCSDLAQDYGVTADGIYYGSIDGERIMFNCKFMQEGGYTVLTKGRPYGKIASRDTILSSFDNAFNFTYSILNRANAIRDSNSGGEFKIRAFVSIPDIGIEFTLPRSTDLQSTDVILLPAPSQEWGNLYSTLPPEWWTVPHMFRSPTAEELLSFSLDPPDLVCKGNLMGFCCFNLPDGVCDDPYYMIQERIPA